MCVRGGISAVFRPGRIVERFRPSSRGALAAPSLPGTRVGPWLRKAGRRMSVDQQDIENELGAPRARALLASTAAAHLAYTGKDGTPRVIPIGFFWTGEQCHRHGHNRAQGRGAVGSPGCSTGHRRGRHARGCAGTVDAWAGERADCRRRRHRVPRRRQEPWMPKRRTSSSDAAASSTTNRRASRSRQPGCATTTSAPAEYHDSCRILRSGTSREGRDPTQKV